MARKKQGLKSKDSDIDPIEKARQSYEKDVEASSPSSKKKKAIMKANKKRVNLAEAYKKWHWTPDRYDKKN